MFVKKLVEKASLKKPGVNLDGLKSEDVNPRLVFHYGITSGSILFAYDSIQMILAISTKDGRIKLYGKDNSQSLLESAEAVPSKFLKFIENQGFLLNVNTNNNIEVWDVDKKLLSHVHVSKEEITSFTVLGRTTYMYVGDSAGNVTVLKLDQNTCNLVSMKYIIPLSASHGNTTEAAGDAAVMFVLPQPTAESNRLLIVYKDGFITLWSLHESKVIFTTGGTMMQSVCHDTKKVTAACWACPCGSKLVVGYSNGELLIWSVPPSSASKTDLVSNKELCATQGAPMHKLNLGYKLDKVPIASLKWLYADGKASRLYVMGGSDSVSSNMLQVILMNDHAESRTTKLGLDLPEPCVDMEIIPCLYDQNKHKQDLFLVLGKSGHVYAYDDCSIEKYLLQCQSRSMPSLPKEVTIKLPFADSSITVSQFFTRSACPADEDSTMVTKNSPALFSFESSLKDGTQWNSANFSGFSKVKNLYITGHSNGAVYFWDLSCPLFLPILSLGQQSEDDFSLSGVEITALNFEYNSQLFVSGDQSGMVRIIKFKVEPFTSTSIFMSLQGNSKKGSNHFINSFKIMKVNGAVLSISINPSTRQIAVGSDQGYVSLIDTEGPSLLYHKHIASELCRGVISVQFESCSFNGFQRNVLVVLSKDSSVLALETETGNNLSSSVVRSKKPSRALFMQILDMSKGNLNEEDIPKQMLLLICSEKAAYVYSLEHAVQGVKKVIYKKKFHSNLCYYASIFYTPCPGLILLFSGGKIEIRSLPELSLLKETSVRGLPFSTTKPNSISESSICSSLDGELIMVNGDKEIFFVSVLHEKQIYRHLDIISEVYKKDCMRGSQQELSSGPVIHKEKKKGGIFSSIMKDTKAKQGPAEAETGNLRESIEDQLSMIFSVANFPFRAESRENHLVLQHDQEVVELDIDDIDLDDEDPAAEKPKGHSVIATALNTQKLSSRFQALKGKLKQMKVKNEKPLPPREEEDKVDAVDQIKRRYGLAASSGVQDTTSVAKMAESKLNENLKKLQGISLRTAEMQDTAQSFSSMAKELLRSAERDRRTP